MNGSMLTPAKQHPIAARAWFSQLCPALRTDILASAQVRRVKHGAPVTTLGAATNAWCDLPRSHDAHAH